MREVKAEVGDIVARRSPTPVQATLDSIIDRYAKKVLRQSTKEPAAFLIVTESGKWVTTADGYWTAGFWVGQLWWLWQHTGDPVFRTTAERYQTLLAPRKDAAEVLFSSGFPLRLQFRPGIPVDR